MMMNIENISNELASTAERVVGITFDPEVIYKVIRYTVRKCELNGKGEDYIPVLFENELRDYLMRREINERGELNYVLQQNA